MATTNEDLRKLRLWGREASHSNHTETVLAAEYYAMALNDQERSVISSEFEEGVRNSGVNQDRVTSVLWDFRDWCKYFEFYVQDFMMQKYNPTERKTDANL